MKKKCNNVPKIDKIIKYNLEITIKSRIMLWLIFVFAYQTHDFSGKSVNFSVLWFSSFRLG